MNISDYVHGPWIVFSSENNIRQIPSIKDGQVVATRKLLWALKNQKELETVERLGLHAAAQTAYKHGGENICDSLAKMVQGFPGTNNVPLFMGEGTFGNPIDKDPSANRYISAKISDYFRLWFRKEDDPILPLRIQRGSPIEPFWLAPVAPMCLVNGSFGIGTGYACNLYQHNPRDVLEAVLSFLENGEFNGRLIPWWKGWKGTITPDSSNQNKFWVTGAFERVGATQIVVKELPPSWNKAKYQKAVIVPLIDAKDSALVDFQNDSSELEGWNITFTFKRGFLSKLSDEEIVNMLQLRTSITHVLSLWDTKDKIKVYDNVEQILEEWIVWRVGVYEQRRKFQIHDLEERIKWELLKIRCLEVMISAGRAIPEETIKQMVFAAGYEAEALSKIMNTPVRRLTVEGIQDGENLVEKYRIELSSLKNITAEGIMEREIREILSKLN